MKILITGATGFIGSKLVETLILKSHSDIRILTTNKKKAMETIAFPVDIKEWNPEKGYIEQDSFTDVDVLFHLAGENVADSRWSEKRKEQILKSRVLGTKLLISEIKKLNAPIKKIISSSAVGIYGNCHDEIVTTNSKLGSGFLADVCKKWEQPILESNLEGVKVHILRTGVVLGTEGGALKKMLLPFLMGTGGILGSGKQYMSWIHREDLVGAFIYLMENDCKHTIYNGVSPKPVTNKEFTTTIGCVIKRPTIFPVPAIALKLLFGEMSEILLEGQRVIPNNLEDVGFKFKFPNLDIALEDLLRHEKKSEVLFKKFQWVDSPVNEVFNFFSTEKNLEELTPAYLKFKVLAKDTDKIQEGSIIDYKLKIHGVPVKWKTRINKFEHNVSFIDEQLKGPYTKWVHQHDFIPLKSGTLIADKVVYKVPFGFLGKLLVGWFIQNDVNNIFNYRRKVINKLF